MDIIPNSLHRELEQARAKIAELEAELACARNNKSESRLPDPELLLGIAGAFTALDREFRIEWANAEAERIIRKPYRELLGRVIWEMLPSCLASPLEQTCRSVLDSQVPAEVEAPWEPHELWYRSKVYPTRDGGLAIFWQDITDQKRLLEVQERQARVLEQVHDSVITTDLNGFITRWNHGAEAIFGYSREEAIGQHVSMLYFEEDRPKVLPLVFEPLLRNGKHEVELRNVRKSGEECYIRLSLSLLRDENNQAYTLLGVAVDTTAQRRAEMALREREALYRCLVETVPQIVYLASPDGKTEMIGSRWEDYSGVSADRILGLNWTEWIHPDDIVALIEQWRQCVETGQEFERIYRVRNAAGEYRWHLSRSRPVRDSAGVITQWVGVLTDVHDHKVAEDKLRLSEERMRMAQDAAGFGHFELDLRTGEFVISDALRRLLEVEPGKEITIAQKLERIHPDDRSGVEEAIEQARTGAAPKVIVSYRTLPVNGSLRWRILEAKVLADADGMPSRLIGVIADVTARKMAADAIRLDQERRQLESIFRSLTEAVIIVSADGSVLSMNPAAMRLHEFDPDAALPKNVSEIAGRFLATQLDGSPIPLEEWPASKALRGEVFTGIELIATNLLTGSTWIGSYGGAPVRDESGAVVMAVMSIRDITAQRRSSEEVRQANKALHDLSGQLLRLQDSERRRIARELHDGSVQLLSAAIMNLTLLEDSAVFHEDSREKRLRDRTMELVQQCTKELRTMSYLLHPPALDELGFVPALLSWVDGFSERSGISVDMVLPSESIRFSPDVETALFRITQEALGNVHRHSKCQTASIKLEVGSQSVCLEIADDGIGFTSPSSRTGVGLLGMRERSIQLGGTFSVESHPGRTVVKAVLPVQHEHA